jgi:hypothetical protein
MILLNELILPKLCPFCFQLCIAYVVEACILYCSVRVQRAEGHGEAGTGRYLLAFASSQ